jgi:hypothetical protein
MIKTYPSGMSLTRAFLVLAMSLVMVLWLPYSRKAQKLRSVKLALQNAEEPVVKTRSRLESTSGLTLAHHSSRKIAGEQRDAGRQ